MHAKLMCHVIQQMSVCTPTKLTFRKKFTYHPNIRLACAIDRIEIRFGAFFVGFVRPCVIYSDLVITSKSYLRIVTEVGPPDHAPGIIPGVLEYTRGSMNSKSGARLLCLLVS